MTKEQAIALKAGDRIRYNGNEAAFVRLIKSMRGALIDAGKSGHPHYMAVTLSELEAIS